MEFFEIISSYFLFYRYYFTDCNLIIGRRIEEAFSFCFFFFLPLDSGRLAKMTGQRIFSVDRTIDFVKSSCTKTDEPSIWCFWEFIFIFIRQPELNILIKLSEVSCLVIIEIAFYKEPEREREGFSIPGIEYLPTQTEVSRWYWYLLRIYILM